ncbi:MAG: hypothetical protein KDA61_06200, partial [Planctomycetales bacterium]|nr:hypothetical protein [Planctomycetales bacterium]
MANTDSGYNPPQLPAKGSSGDAMIPVSTASPSPSLGIPGAGGPDVLRGGFDQTWLINCLRRRWLSALMLGCLMGLATTALLLWLFPESSSTVAYLKVEMGDSTQTLNNNRSKMSNQEMERHAATQLALLKSQYVLQTAVINPNITVLQAVRDQGQPDDAVLWLYDELRVSFPNEGNILEIRYEGEENPEDMVKIIDQVVAEYKNQAIEEERKRQIGIRETMEGTLRIHQQKLQRLMEDYESLAKVRDNAHSATAEVETTKLQRELVELSKEISKVKAEITDVDVIREVAVVTFDSPTALENQVQSIVSEDPILKQYEEQLMMLQQQHMSLKGRSKNPNSRELASLQGQMRQLESAMREHRAQQERQVRDQLKRLPKEGLKTVLAEYQIRKGRLSQTLEELNQQMEEKNERLLELGTRDPELDMKLAEIESQQQIASDLALAIEGWKIDEEAITNSVRVINKATAKSNINVIERLTIAAVGGLASLLLT